MKPLRKIVERTQGHYWRLYLECGHSLLSYSGRRNQKNIRCEECPDG